MKEELPVISAITSQQKLCYGFNQFRLDYLAEIGIPDDNGNLLEILDEEGSLINKTYASGISRDWKKRVTYVTVDVFWRSSD